MRAVALGWLLATPAVGWSDEAPEATPFEVTADSLVGVWEADLVRSMDASVLGQRMTEEELALSRSAMRERQLFVAFAADGTATLTVMDGGPAAEEGWLWTATQTEGSALHARVVESDGNEVQATFVFDGPMQMRMTVADEPGNVLFFHRQ